MEDTPYYEWMQCLMIPFLVMGFTIFSNVGQANSQEVKSSSSFSSEISSSSVSSVSSSSSTSSGASSSYPHVSTKIDPETPLTLSEAIDSKLNGIDRESMDAKSLILKQAREFLAIKNRGGKELPAGCDSEPEKNPFCEIAKRGWQNNWPVSVVEESPAVKESPKEKVKETNATQKETLNLVKEIQKGTLIDDPDSKWTESSYFRAMRKFDRVESVFPLSQKVAADTSCRSPMFAMALALKLEEFFPEKKIRDLAIALYEKVDRCGDSQNPRTATARFRLSLLYVWDGQCKKAEPVLEKVAQDRQGDFVSRAFFWKGWCARKWNDSQKLSKARADLFSVNPLGFHTLSLHEKKSEVVKKASTKDWDKEPTIRFRTEKMPPLNAWVRALEAMEQVGSRGNVNHLLSVVRMRAGFLDTIEPEFRVYLAVLASRNQDTISLFRILDGLFRSDIQTVSGPLMKLFYPLRYEGYLKTYATQVDPLLVAALIRQESGYNERAQSRVGARGLMQLMPYTAKKLKKVTIKQLYDPKINIELGVKYIQMLLERFEGDIELSLAGYNAGPEKVDQWTRRYPTDNRMLFLDLMPYKETRNYVALIGRNYYWYDYLYRSSFAENRKKTEFNALNLRN